MERAFRTIDCSSWRDFAFGKLFELTDGSRFGQWIFRGQPDATWALQPSWWRRNRGWSGSQRDLAETMIGLVRKFSADLERQGFPTSLTRDNIAVLALAQHYGVPTTLLDWSLSPYVAAYFASHRQSDAESLAVWALDTSHPLVIDAGKVTSDTAALEPYPSLLFAYPPRYANIRLRNQEGAFTILRAKVTTIEGFLSSELNGESPLVKFVFPSQDRKMAQEDLVRMQVSDGSLFPGIEQAARRVRDWLDQGNCP